MGKRSKSDEDGKVVKHDRFDEHNDANDGADDGDADAGAAADQDKDAGGDGAATSKRKRKRKRKNKGRSEDDNNNDDADADNNTEGSGNQDATDDAMVNCTVYVVGIPFDASPEDVRHFFTSDGIANVVEMRLPTWQDSGRLRGYGHVVFENATDYAKALKLSGKYMGKRYLTVEPCKAPRSGGTSAASSSLGDGARTGEPPTADCRTLFVGNLPYSAVEEDIIKVFEQFGSLPEEGGGVRIARNSVNRQSKGFCYVEFEEPSSAQAAVKAALKRRINVGGRNVRVDYDSGRMKGSYRTENGRLWSKEVKNDKRPQAAN